MTLYTLIISDPRFPKENKYLSVFKSEVPFMICSKGDLISFNTTGLKNNVRVVEIEHTFQEYSQGVEQITWLYVVDEEK